MLLLSRKPHDFFLPDFSPLALLSTSMPGWRLHLGKHGGATGEILLGAGGHMSAEPVVLTGLLWVRGNPGRVIIYIWPTPKPTRALNTGPTPLISEAQSWPTRKARPSTVPDLRCFYSSLLQQESAGTEPSPIPWGHKVSAVHWVSKAAEETSWRGSQSRCKRRQRTCLRS